MGVQESWRRKLGLDEVLRVKAAAKAGRHGPHQRELHVI